ncbi:MAG: hypothetical protein EXS17_01370 [Phycisphaerales bacterium]|nr:hypothetical protein [Phycisphaerales bacterium]
MATRTTLAARFLQLPPAWRFAIAGMGVCCVYLLLDDYCWSYAREWSQEASRLQRLLERGEARRVPLANDVERAAIAFGNAEIPDDEARTSESLALAVNETMKKHHITSFGYEALGGGKFPSNAMSSIAGTGRRIERLRGDVGFSTSADKVAQVLADFEANPSIDAINSVTLRWRDDQKKVDFRLSAEAWAIAPRDNRSRGGS